jgi:uncharacterized membrane protein
MNDSSVIIFIGLLVALSGLTMSSTQTSTIEGCVEGQGGISGDEYCSGVESTTEITTSNPWKEPTIGLGILLIFIGSFVSYKKGASSGTSDSSSDAVLRVSSEVIDSETGETTTLALPVHTDSVEVASERFKSRCEKEGYEVQGEPQVEVKRPSEGN